MKKLVDIYKVAKKYHFYGILLIGFSLLKKKYHHIQLRKMVKNENKYLEYLINHDIQVLNTIITDLPELTLKNHIHEIKNRNLYGEESRNIIHEADLICTNHFNILGSGWISWTSNNKIDWHKDMKNNVTWDRNKYYTDISKLIKENLKIKNKHRTRFSENRIHPPVSPLSKGGSRESNYSIGDKQLDAKIPRELSRFYFIFPLFFAFIYTDKDKYINKIKELLYHWIDENPPFYGVNWSNAMEAAIRISNWCFIVYSLKSYLLKDKNFTTRFYKSLTEHVIYILKNLENIFLKNNHYISNVTGIYVINTLFPIFKKSNKWLNLSIRKLKKELNTQVYPDGGHSENSTAYHRLVTELFFLPLYIAQHFNTNHFQIRQYQKLEKMFYFILHIIKPNGRIIQFGDNDSGRLFKLFNRDSLNQSYMLSLAYGLLKNSAFSIKEFSFDILSYILFGHEIYNDYQKNVQSIYSRNSNIFYNTGIYTFVNIHYYLAVSCMSNNRDGKNIHTHNDKLSYEMAYKTYDIIVDPGTYVYGSNQTLRNRYRSTSFHNTVYENKRLEQNRLGNSIFNLSNDSTVKVNGYNTNYLDCQHNGFTKQGGHIHQRIFTLDDRSIKIKDIINAGQTASCAMHFAPDITLYMKDSYFIIQNQNIDLLTLQIDNSVKIKKEKYKFSPGYGELQEAIKLIIHFKKELSMVLTIIN